MNPTFKQVTKTRYVQLVSELAQEIFVQHYTKLTPKVAAALADKYKSDILTDDEIHSGVINYFLIYLGTEPVGYFALDLPEKTDPDAVFSSADPCDRIIFIPFSHTYRTSLWFQYCPAATDDSFY